MNTVKRLVILAAVGILLFAGAGRAQAQDAASSIRANTTVTAFAAADHVRFTAPATVVQMRLEVYAANGQKSFDNEIRGGNVVDWLLQDGQARRLSDGPYLCVITTKSLSGNIAQKSGKLVIENTVASIQPLDTTQLTAQQIQAVGPLEENASLTVVNEDQNQTATVIAHDGSDGQITRGRGALSFRIGDFFSGEDVEQMRLTPEGNLGIGITNPVVRLDVDGLIRAGQGIVFPDGSIQYSASRKTFGPESLRPGQSLKKGAQAKDFETASPDISGTGTTGKISKWSDGPNGVLADSNITEVSGAIGINGTPNTNFRLDVNGSVLFRGSNPGFNLVGLRPAGNTWAFQTVDDDGRFRLFGQDNVNPGVERLTLSLSTGYFGISNPGPLSKLHIVSAASDLPPRLQSAGASSFAAGWDFYHGTTGKGYVGVPDPSAGFGGGELLLFGGAGTRTSLWANSNRTMTLDTGGNVGIGTTTPTSRMEIVAQDGLKITGFQPFLTLKDTNAGNKSSFMQGINGDVFLLTNSRAALIVKDLTGAVGIGTNTPTAQLHVVGGGNAVYASSTSGSTIYGDNVSLFSDAIGVFGRTGAGGSGTGVEGIGKTGVQGSGSSEGVVGLATQNGGRSIYGGHAAGVTSWTAGYFDGDAFIQNDLLMFGNFHALGDKNFVEPHSTDPTKMIKYVCLEGPEAGTYFRGSGRITNGSAIIEAPEDFRMVSDEKGITVQVTPMGEAATIWCVRKSLDAIELRGSADVEFDFLVNGVRRASKDHKPIVENTIFVPRSADDDRFKNLNPEAVRRLKATGILNEDGSVNMEIVQTLDAYKRMHKPR